MWSQALKSIVVTNWLYMYVYERRVGFYLAVCFILHKCESWCMEELTCSLASWTLRQLLMLWIHNNIIHKLYMYVLMIVIIGKGWREVFKEMCTVMCFDYCFTSPPGSTIAPRTTWPWMVTTRSSTGSTAEPGTLLGGSSEELWVSLGGWGQ